MDISKILNILLEFGKTILYEKDIDNLLQSISYLTRDLVNADRCSIFLYNTEKNTLYTKIAHGIDNIELPADKGVVGYTAQTGEPQIVVDVNSDIRFYAEVDKITGYKTKNLVTIPLLDSENKVFGVLEAVNKKEGFFDNFDAELLMLSASYISYILENALLNNKLKENNLKIIYKLSTAAEFKDEDTSLHTKRVAYYSEIIVSGLEVESEFKELIKIAAPMHDVGKIGIPDKILLKEGKLTKEEFDIIKTHPTIGYNILKDKENKLLTIAANISLDHHEKWNGKGYPNNKKGLEISLEGRIVAISDVFDALISKRPYKEPWSFEKAIKYIEQEKGSHFDPDMVNIFIDKVDLVKDIYLKYREE